MEITCKVLKDTRKLKLILQREAKVSDLIDQLKDDLGSENEYQLICLGRIMLECDTLSRYTQSEKLPILIKTFTPENIMEATREIRNLEICCRKFNNWNRSKKRKIDHL